jgi:hypothetical protein
MLVARLCFIGENSLDGLDDRALQKLRLFYLGDTGALAAHRATTPHGRTCPVVEAYLKMTAVNNQPLHTGPTTHVAIAS